MNLVIEKGRLTKAPEMSYTANGKCVATFTIAVAKIVRKDAPADTPRANFIRCVAWENTAQFIGNYFDKGSEILVTGSLETRNYKAKDGSARYVTEVKVSQAEFCGSKPSNSTSQPQGEFEGGSNVQDEDIPF